MNIHHTPGPWTPWPPEGTLGGFQDVVHYEGSAPTAIVAQVVREDDARIIAAAPELLRACLLAVAHYIAQALPDIPAKSRWKLEERFQADYVSALAKAGIDAEHLCVLDILELLGVEDAELEGVRHEANDG